MEELHALVELYYRALYRDPSLTQIPSNILKQNEKKQIKKIKKNNAHTLGTNNIKDKKHDNKEQNITVYGKNFCQYCQSAKKLIKHKPGAVYIELEENFVPRLPEHTPIIQKATTIPIVFVDSTHIGGLEDLQKII